MTTSFGCIPMYFITGSPERLVPDSTMKGLSVFIASVVLEKKASDGTAISVLARNSCRFMLVCLEG